MTMQRILVALDGSPLSESILGLVRSLAGRLGAEVTLLHVVHMPESFRAGADVTLDGVVKRERRFAEWHLGHVARTLANAGLVVRTSVAVGDAAVEIVRAADREKSDLLALATHGRSGMWRWLHGSVAEAVLHGTTRPLLLVRPGVAAPPVGDIRRVIVPLDGSPVAEQALPLARELAQRLVVPIELLQVVEIPNLAFAGDALASGSFDDPHMLETLEAGATGYLEGIAARERRDGLRVDVKAMAGAAAQTIALHHATRTGSLLVIRSHGRSGWRAALLGSVARRVVALTEGPVLVVRPAPPTAT